jgi:hypothetical protein
VVHAPAHDIWGTVNCDSCADKFLVGPNRVHGSRISAEECAKRLDAMLAEDHKRNKPHADSYELPDNFGEDNLVDKVFISWIGPSSLGVELNGVAKAFSLEEGQVVPPEFKAGDLVELHLQGDPAAEIRGIENSKGCYLFKHISSGKEFKTWHRAEGYRLDPLAKSADAPKK